MAPLTRSRAAAEAPTLLDALARAPAAAVLVFAALGEADRRALRLVHTQLRDAVGEATTTLHIPLYDSATAAARPPTPRRWPRLEKLTVFIPNLPALEALGAETWDGLRSLRIERPIISCARFDAPSARALAAALRRMPALRALELRYVDLPDAAAEELFRPGSAEDVPQLRALTLHYADLASVAARALAATGWRLEELDLYSSRDLAAAGVSALLAAPTFALRRLNLGNCGLDAAALLSVANAPWPLEELNLRSNDFSAAASGPALVALSRHAGLRRLNLSNCSLSAAGVKALLEAAWPALASLAAEARPGGPHLDGPHALGAAAFAGLPALEELDLDGVKLGAAGAALFASRRWARLRRLSLPDCRLGDAGLAALARGEFPALERLVASGNRLGAPLELEDARRWAPTLLELDADVGASASEHELDLEDLDLESGSDDDSESGGDW